MSSPAILCVDDEQIPRTLRTLVLKKHGYEVVAVASGKEALEKLSTGSFDLVLTDQLMPGMVGTELARQVKALTPNMPVVIVSGVNELPEGAAVADRFISKIAGPEALLRAIAETFEQYAEQTVDPSNSSGSDIRQSNQTPTRGEI